MLDLILNGTGPLTEFELAALNTETDRLSDIVECCSLNDDDVIAHAIVQLGRIDARVDNSIACKTSSSYLKLCR